ncbi:MAG: GlsB/YeaQ/YmgE family stress response membrane protein [Candidatus Dormiibacterota bacterium]
MLHVIAFIVIGVVIGALYIRQSRGAAATIRVIAGLAGALIGGFVSLAILGSSSTTGKYGSLLVAIVVAVVLSALAAVGTRPSAG